ncbi:uncharacterized protein LOC132048928 [Lycium ferocissimum]|uniref:uncharacterized protein LOC132048928 n=1 Tax=Lycium ferocissimum TaxID=112874 RepID=UPI002815D014|nr:uncharacterized protein LOC132048928 [Lycium ferocissimum]
MDKEDAEKTTFITPWGVYHYRVMPFDLKNASATYMRAMTTTLHNTIHKKIEVYVDDVIIKSRESSEHTTYLRKFFDRLGKFNLKLNPAKCAFGVPIEKLLGFVVSRRSIELDSAEFKVIQELPPPKIKKEVMSFLGRLNYIGRFIDQSTIVEPILKLLKKDAPIKCKEECQEAFDTIKRYLSNSPVLVPPRPGSPLLLCLSVSENTFRCVLGQHDEICKMERAIYYLSKKFTACEKAVKGQDLADLLVESPADEDLEPLQTHFANEGVLAIEKETVEPYTGWRLFFDGVVNYKALGIGAVLISETGQHYPMLAKFKFHFTNNMAEYEAFILGLRMALDMDINELLVIGDSNLLIHQVQGEWATKNDKILPYVTLAQRMCKKFKKIKFRHIPRAQNEFADRLAIIASMIQHPEISHINPLEISLREEYAYYSHVEAEPDGKPCYNDIKIYLKKWEYPEGITSGQRKTIRRMATDFFLNKEILYKRMPYLGLL